MAPLLLLLLLLLLGVVCGAGAGSAGRSLGGPASAAGGYPSCSCANQSLCAPLPHGPPPADVHVYSDCGGPWSSRTKAGTSACDWHAFDFETTTTLVRMVGHPITVGVDGAVHLNTKAAGGWPESELLCHAHAHDVRVLVPILADASSDKSGRYYEHLLGNATAVNRMASELLGIVTAAGWDGVEFDFEGMWSEITPGTTFDFAAHHVAMIKATVQIFHASLPHSTVALTMGAADFTSPSAAVILKAYPIPGLADAADQIFVMAYDMWHGHVVCAGPNAPLPAVVSSLKSFLQLGAQKEKLVLGIPWYGYEYRCNSTMQSTTLKECIGVGQPSCLVGTLADRGHGYGLGVWAVEEVLANHSSGCTKEWSEEFSSPYVNCPAGSEPLPNGGHRFPWAGPPSVYTTQTWYDDANSTALKVQAALDLKLGGVGVFTGEGLSKAGATSYWQALEAFKQPRETSPRPMRVSP